MIIYFPVFSITVPLKGNGLSEDKRDKIGNSKGTEVSAMLLPYEERLPAPTVAPGRPWKRPYFLQWKH